MVQQSKVVIIGGGFGGLAAARGMRRGVAEVVVLDKTNHHLFQPLLYQVASAALSPGDIARPIREVLQKQKNAVVLMGEVVSIDKEGRQVKLANGDLISYDYLIVAAGARHAYFGHDEWEPFAPGLKTLNDAIGIRERLLMSFEKAERCESLSEAERYLNFVVIGGGPTGVELAGAIGEIAHKTMIRNFRRIDPEKAKIILVEGAPHVLPSYPEELALRAQKDLEKLGVEVLTNQMVTNISREGVQVGDRFIPASNVIWAAGNQAAPVLKTLDVPLDRQGRVIVGPDLSIPDHPEVFVIGDAASAEGSDGKPLVGIAPVAVQQGQYVAKLIRKRHKERKPFVYFDKGMMATIGKNKAVASIGNLRLQGFIAWLAWGFIHIAYLIGFRSRLAVMLSWSFWYMTGRRGARLIRGSLTERKRE
jgi:NADH:quinone reductase (non-electrogenic)